MNITVLDNKVFPIISIYLFYCGTAHISVVAINDRLFFPDGFLQHSYFLVIRSDRIGVVSKISIPGIRWLLKESRPRQKQMFGKQSKIGS